MKSRAVLAAAIVLIAGSTASADFTLSGTEHMDISTARGDGFLYDYSSADIHAWGSIGNAYLYDNARLRLIEDYSYVGVCAYTYGSSQLSMSASISDIRYLEAYNSSVVDISAGHVAEAGNGGYLQAYDNSIINISGGSVGNPGKGVLAAEGSSTVNISDNAYVDRLHAKGTSAVNISGGGIQTALCSYQDSRISITGGDLYSGLDAYDYSQVKIRGGQVWAANIHGNCLTAHNDAIITFYGSDFEIDGLSIAYGRYYASDFATGKISGRLSAGGDINNTFFIYDNASIVLVPEPTSLALFALAAFVLRTGKYRRQYTTRLLLTHKPCQLLKAKLRPMMLPM